VSFKFENVARIYKYDQEKIFIDRFNLLLLDYKILNENILEFVKIYPSILNQ
jgi:hypothetical protein